MYAMTMSGRTTVDLKPPDAAGQLVRALERLDGANRFSLVLFRLPEGAALDDVDLSSYPVEYLQCAGSQERMTVELRLREQAGLQHYVLGRDVPPVSSQPPDDVIRWSTFETRVYSSEVFTGSEAAEIFLEYLNTGAVPARYSRRPLAL